MADEDYAAWDRGNIRGVGGKRRFVGTETDLDGREINVYEVQDDEWGTAVGPEVPMDKWDDRWRHMNFHKAVIDPRCPYCQKVSYGER